MVQNLQEVDPFQNVLLKSSSKNNLKMDLTTNKTFYVTHQALQKIVHFKLWSCTTRHKKQCFLCNFCWFMDLSRHQMIKIDVHNIGPILL